VNKVLTDRAIAALKPAPAGKRVFIGDVVVPNFGVRISGAHFSYVLRGRFNSKHATFRTIAEVGEISLADARGKAREWLLLVKAGTDPKREPKRTTDNSFGFVAEAFIKRKLPGQRQAARVAHQIRTELKSWWNVPIGEIARRDVVELLEKVVDRPAPAYARNIHGHLRVLFDWAINRGLYGLDHSPTDRIKIASIIGERKMRTRVLSDDEIRAVWAACEAMGYPFGPAAKLLLLTGARNSEISKAQWEEIDERRRVLVLPAERAKSKTEEIIPLSGDAWAIVEGLPHWKSGFLFSFKGDGPISTWYDAKKKLDEISGVRGWVIHDLRRSMRTNLSALRIPDNVAELALRHAKTGLRRVYDQHRYEDEVREAMEAWAARVKTILDPGSNVLRLRAGSPPTRLR
jgi:integrase